MKAVLFMLVLAAAASAAVDVGTVRARLKAARSRLDDGEPAKALAQLEPALAEAAGADLAREEAAAALLASRAHHALGQRAQAIPLAARAMRRARDASDPALALAIAAGAEDLTRRLGENGLADQYLRLAQEEAAKRGLDGPTPETFAAGETPRMPETFAVKKKHVAPDPPLGIHSARSQMAAFRRRVKEDPEYLANLTRLKGFRDDPNTTPIAVLEGDGIHVPKPRFLSDDFKTLSKAYAYYKFVVKFSRTLDDEFGLATLYLNMTFLKTEIHPAMGIVYGLAKGAAIAEAASRIISLSVTGTQMHLAILALDKSIIDIIRRYDRRDRSKPANISDDDDDVDEDETDD